jgi:hypothetical protein
MPTQKSRPINEAEGKDLLEGILRDSREAEKIWEKVEKSQDVNRYRTIESIFNISDALEGKIPDANRYKIIESFADIPNTPFFFPSPDYTPNPEWVMFYGDTVDAARDAARRAAPLADRGTGWDVALSVMTYEAAQAAGIKAELDAVQGEVGFAVTNSAWSVAPKAAWFDAAWDKALIIGYWVVENTEFKYKEEIGKYLDECDEILDNGFGHLCDVGGTPFGGKHYVFAKTPVGLRKE